MGPLKMFRLRLANMTPLPENGFGLPGGCGIMAPLKAGSPSLKTLRGGPLRSRTRRMLLGKVLPVGVAGKTLTEWWGLRAFCIGVLETDVETEPFDDVELALLWLWWCV